MTTGDYEALARSFDGVGKVRATATGWNRVTLYVAPSGFAASSGKGDPTDTGERNVTDTLELGLKRFLKTSGCSPRSSRWRTWIPCPSS